MTLSLLILPSFFRLFQEHECEPSFLVVEINNVVFYDSVAGQYTSNGLAAFVVQNCSFVGSESRPRALHLMDVMYVSVTNCKFQTYNLLCWQGCAISVRGVHTFSNKFKTFLKAFSHHNI